MESIRQVCDKINSFKFTPEEHQEIADCVAIIFREEYNLSYNEVNYLQLIKFILYTQVLLKINYYRDIFINNIFINNSKFLKQYTDVLLATSPLMPFPEIFEIFNSGELNVENYLEGYCFTYNLKMVRHIIEKCIEDKSKIKNVMMIAVKMKCNDIIEYLVDNRIDMNYKSLIEIYTKNNQMMIKYLNIDEIVNFDKYENENQKIHISDILPSLIKFNHDSILEKCSNKIGYNTIARYACMSGNERIFLKYRLANQKYLKYAVKSNNMSLIQGLYAQEKPDVGQLNECMLSAVREKNEKSIDYLLELGADIDSTFIYAVQFRNKSLIFKMIDKGADRHSCYEMAYKRAMDDGWTDMYQLFEDENLDVQEMFHYACEKLTYESIKRFHQKDAKIDQTSFGLALESQNIKNICYIYYHGRNIIKISPAVRKRYASYFDQVDKQSN